MKNLLRALILVGLAFVSVPAQAQWAGVNGEKFLSHINTFVFADFVAPHKVDDDVYAAFKIREVLKGRNVKVGQTLHLSHTNDLVRGKVVDIANLKPGRYLLIVHHHWIGGPGKVCSPANDTFSALPVTNDQVLWPPGLADPKLGFKEVPTKLDVVRKQVGAVAAVELKAYAEGVAEATAEIAKGVLNYDLATDLQSRAGDFAAGETLEKKYGFNIRFYSNVIYEAVDRERMNGHRDTVSAHLKKKFGDDPVIKYMQPWRVVKPEAE
ncbi:MAG: hypothetical protein ACJAVK_002034 [Akkermansiaceae bacterium]|jgi:hypothetical protein